MYHDEGEAAGTHLFAPVHVQDVAGVRIGILGFNDPKVPVRQPPSFSEGIRFTLPEEEAAALVQHLRQDRGCDLVLALTHLGIGQQVALAEHEAMAGVDYILGADTHERVREPIRGTHCAVTEPGAFGSFVGRLDLIVEDGRIRDRSYELLEVSADRYDEDPVMQRVVEQVEQPYREELGTVLGATRTPLLRYYPLETPMDDLITDALLEVTRDELAGQDRHVDVALSNGFRFCPPLVPAAGGTADITREYLWSMLPIDSVAQVATVPGALIEPWLERELHNVFAQEPSERFGGWVVRMSGMTVEFTAGGSKGERVRRVEIGGAPLDPEQDYVFVSCERDGDPPDVLCRLRGVEDREDLSVTMHEAVERYLARHSPVAPELDGRVTATDLSPTALGQLPGTDYRFR
jgi:S-sulfosulfanyl-L-cysteine sulfohydrolase